jgi:hypothetical protein
MVTLDYNAPEDPALASIVIAVCPMHRGPITYDEHIALAPRMCVDNLLPNDPADQIIDIGFAVLRRHTFDMHSLCGMGIKSPRMMERVCSHHWMNDWFPKPLHILIADIAAPAIEAIDGSQRIQACPLNVR